MKSASGGKHTYIDTQNTNLPKVHNYRDIYVYFLVDKSGVQEGESGIQDHEGISTFVLYILSHGCESVCGSSSV